LLKPAVPLVVRSSSPAKMVPKAKEEAQVVYFASPAAEGMLKKN
jgi:hypothetical protein